MTRLEPEPAESQIAKRVGTGVAGVKNLAIWGNTLQRSFRTSPTQPVDGQSVVSAVNDDAWLQGDFIFDSAKRGAAGYWKQGERVPRRSAANRPLIRGQPPYADARR